MSRRPWKGAKRWAGYALLLAGRRLFGLLPRACAERWGERLGRLAWRLARTERRRTLEHLALAFGEEMDEAARAEIGHRVFGNLGRVAVELLRAGREGPERIAARVEAPEAERVAEAARERGAVCVIAHMGNWELLAAVATRHLPVTVVARRLYFAPYERLAARLRAHVGLRVVYQDESPRPLLRALRGGGLVGILADQDVRHAGGAFVPFFGRPAYTPTAPAALARASGAPLYLAVAPRVDGRYRLLLEGPIETKRGGSREEDVLAATADWSARLEKIIRRYPDQWVWMHRRWRTTPAKRPEAPVWTPPA